MSPSSAAERHHESHGRSANPFASSRAHSTRDRACSLLLVRGRKPLPYCLPLLAEQLERRSISILPDNVLQLVEEPHEFQERFSWRWLTRLANGSVA